MAALCKAQVLTALDGLDGLGAPAAGQRPRRRPARPLGRSFLLTAPLVRSSSKVIQRQAAATLAGVRHSVRPAWWCLADVDRFLRPQRESDKYRVTPE